LRGWTGKGGGTTRCDASAHELFVIGEGGLDSDAIAKAHALIWLFQSTAEREEKCNRKSGLGKKGITLSDHKCDQDNHSTGLTTGNAKERSAGPAEQHRREREREAERRAGERTVTFGYTHYNDTLPTQFVWL
jgi:hypothetical protein